MDTHDDNTTPPDRDRPLGYWLRTVDALIADAFRTSLRDEGVGRRDWMLLHALADGGRGLGPRRFGPPDPFMRGGKHLHRLEERGWIARTDDGWTLTDEGRAAHARLSGIVGGIRERVAGAVSPDDFATTVSSLEAIAREFGWEAGASLPRRGRGFGPGRHHGPHRHDGFGPHLRPGGCGRGADGACGKPHRGGHGPGQRAERAFERGFEAGFAAARRAEASGPAA